jgi:hypothetical protein
LREQLEGIRGKLTLVRHLAALRPGPMVSTAASAKAALKAIARRWLVLREEIEGHDRELDRLVSTTAPDLTAARGVATATAAEMLLLVGDNPERVRSEGALAKPAKFMMLAGSSESAAVRSLFGCVDACSRRQLRGWSLAADRGSCGCGSKGAAGASAPMVNRPGAAVAGGRGA